MGFEPQETQYRLTFEDPDLVGLEVLAGSLTVGEYTAMQRMGMLRPLGNTEGLDRDALLEMIAERAEEAMQANEKILELFASRLVSWNITKGGEPVPATLEGIQGQDSRFISRIIAAWQRALIQGPPPLKEPSPNGANGSLSPEMAAGLLAASKVPPSSPGS